MLLRKAGDQLIISLNQEDEIAEDKIIQKFEYSHPLYLENSQESQAYIKDTSIPNMYFTGAYLGNGFHEDGLVSAIEACKKIDKELVCEAPFIQEE